MQEQYLKEIKELLWAIVVIVSLELGGLCGLLVYQNFDMRDQLIRIRGSVGSISAMAINILPEPKLEVEENETVVVAASPISLEDTQNVDWYLQKPAPGGSHFKPYMDANTLTSRGSDQYKLKTKYELDSKTGIWTVDGRYCVALGSYYTTEIGTYLDIVLANGTIIPCILADCKADQHTDSTNRQNPNGSVVEFIVNEGSLCRKARKRGDCSLSMDGWKGDVKGVIVYE